ncbi:MAG TPA: hypothetical protein VMW94_01670 [Actinomycetes bacterium]|nr:hypothetical protein [Actinomycetes bacterium]
MTPKRIADTCIIAGIALVAVGTFGLLFVLPALALLITIAAGVALAAFGALRIEVGP